MTPPSDSWTPDEIEQRQRLDGTVEQDTPRRREDTDGPLSPDEIEQRQSATHDDEVDLEGADHPLTPDEIEQRTVVGGDDDEPLVDDED